MEEERPLTKKEKRELARERKSEERKKQAFSATLKKVLSIAFILLVVFGLYKLLTAPKKVSPRVGEKFESYASEIGIDVEKYKADFVSDTVRNKVDDDMVSGNALKINQTPTFYLNGEKLENVKGYEALKLLIEKAKADTKQNLLEIKENDRMKGKKEAKIVLIEYSDFQCPACQQYSTIVNRLAEEYKDDLLVIYRNFPLTTLHSNALPAAYAAEAAGVQGKFWEMHDLLFEKQAEWSVLK